MNNYFILVNYNSERKKKMKNKDKKKGCKSCNKDEVIEKKIKTMENGKEYYEEVEKKEDNDKENEE